MIEGCTAFKLNRPEKQLPVQPGDTMKRFEPGDETIITITLRHDQNPPAEFIRNPPPDDRGIVTLTATPGDSDGKIAEAPSG